MEREFARHTGDNKHMHSVNEGMKALIKTFFLNTGAPEKMDFLWGPPISSFNTHLIPSC